MVCVDFGECMSAGGGVLAATPINPISLCAFFFNFSGKIHPYTLHILYKLLCIPGIYHTVCKQKNVSLSPIEVDVSSLSQYVGKLPIYMKLKFFYLENKINFDN